MVSTIESPTKQSVSSSIGEAIEVAILPSSGPDWIKEKREQAITVYNNLGLPTRHDEAWRSTSLKVLKNTPLVLFPKDPPQLSKEQITQFHLPNFNDPVFVFVNGNFAPDLSTIATLPDGVSCNTFDEAWSTSTDILEAHLTKYTNLEKDAFSALNTALLDEGVVVHVTMNAASEIPIHVLNIIASTSAPIAVQPRLLIVAEESSKVTVIEDFVSIGEGACLTNSVTEIYVGANAEVNHYMLERENANSFNISSLKVHQERDSRFYSHSALLGGTLVRNNVNPVLDGEGIESTLNGIYVGNSSQHFDNHMLVEHRKPNCSSRQYYKGILADKSQGIFCGRIIVSQDAQVTDAVQSNQNLLLSRDAQAKIQPQLEIYADDVKCTHGATIGELDHDSLFYLESRGLDKATASALLVFAFASESLERMECNPFREKVRDILLHKLPDSKVLESVIE